MTNSIPKLMLKQALIKRGLPDNTNFLGYVLHIPVSDEFVASYKLEKDGSQFFGYTPIPELSHYFKSYKRAQKVAKHCHYKPNVCEAFDIGEHIFVGLPDEPSQIIS